MDIKEGYKNIDAIIEDVASEMAKGQKDFIKGEFIMFFHAAFNPPPNEQTYNVRYHVNGEMELAIYSICSKMHEEQGFAQIMVHAVKMFMEQVKEKALLAQVQSNFNPVKPNNKDVN